MNKNPFVPAPSYSHQQPPLPPGAPPAQPAAQPDYSAYWAAAAQQQHAAGQQAYNPQWPSTTPVWTAPQPAQPAATPSKPTAEQSALYANYGYGGQQNLQWHQQHHAHTQQQHHYAQPPTPASHPPPAPPQPQYNPYQPQAGAAYQQPYVPQAGGGATQPVVQQSFRPPQPPQQQYFPQQQHHPPSMTHQSPQHLPPAKRQRFDNPPQPRLQAPPPPPMQQQQNAFHGHNRPPGPPGPMPGPNQMQGGGFGMGGGRGGGMSGPRGGGPGGGVGRGIGRGSSMSGNRGGGMGMNRGGGRGGSMYGSGGRGGSGGQPGGPLRGHQSRDRGGFNNNNNNNNYNRRGGGGGSFNGSHHQNNTGNSSFRTGHGRGGPPHANHSRGSGSGNHQNRTVSSPITGGTSAGGKKDENRRTLTDFKLVGLEIQNLDWRWGSVPHMFLELSSEAKTELKAEVLAFPEPVKTEDTEAELVVTPADHLVKTEGKPVPLSSEPTAIIDPPAPPSSISASAPPSRMRIYFHTPPSADDARPIMPSTSFAAPSDSRKGKRKKLEDDDGDIEEGRAPPPRPVPGGNVSVDGDGEGQSAGADGPGRGSLAPSATETASEADWLMAAIADGGGTEDGDVEATQVEGQEHNEMEHEDANLGIEDDQNEQEQHTGHEIHDGDMDGEGDIDENMADLDAQQDELVVTLEHEEQGVAADAVNLNPATISLEAPTESSASAPVVSDTAAPTSDHNSHLGSASTPAPAPIDAATVQSPVLAVDRSLGESSPPQAAALTATGSALPDEQTALRSLPTILSLVQGLSGEGKAVADSAPTSPNAKGDVPRAVVNANGTGLPEKPAVDGEHEHLPEPPASPVSNTLPSSSSTVSTHTDVFSAPAKTATSGGRVPSANRLSISYAAGTRRLVIDADIVDKLRVFRSEGRIEVAMTVKRAVDGFKGILIEALNETTKSYTPLQDLSEASESDLTLPPFWCFVFPTKTTLIVYLDTERPLSEPKWVKTGDVQDWLKSMFGRMFWVAGDAVGWEKKIEVVDPDPAPTIQSVLDGWSSNSPVGTQTERQRFLKTHMSESDNILEILLRLVRGERTTPFSQNAASVSGPSVAGPLLAALEPGSAHGSQQTHVSLAVLAIVRMAVEFAEKALGEGKGKAPVDERVGEIIRCLPSHLLYKSLDGIFKEWRVEKKGGR